MDINKLLLFSDIADTCNLTVSAQRLGYTQSGVSHAVAKLEEEIGFPVLNRTNQGVRLTGDGSALLPKVRSVIYQYDRLLEEINSIKILGKGGVCVGTYASVARRWLPPIITEFRRLYPEIKIRLKEGGISDLESWLYDGTVDFAFLSWRKNSGYKFVSFSRDAIYAVTDKNFKLPKSCGGRFPVSAFLERPLILPDDSFDADVFGAIEESASGAPQVLTCNDEDTIIAMVKSGLGIGMMSGMFLERARDVQAFPLEPEVVRTLGVGMLSERSLSIAAKAFVALSKTMVCDASAATP